MTPAAFHRLRAAAAVRQGTAHDWLSPFRQDGTPIELPPALGRCALVTQDLRRQDRLARFGRAW